MAPLDADGRRAPRLQIVKWPPSACGPSPPWPRCSAPALPRRFRWRAPPSHAAADDFHGAQVPARRSHPARRLPSRRTRSSPRPRPRRSPNRSRPCPSGPYPIHGTLSSLYQRPLLGLGSRSRHSRGALGRLRRLRTRTNGTGHLMVRANADLDGRPSQPSPIPRPERHLRRLPRPARGTNALGAEARTSAGLDHVRAGRAVRTGRLPVFAWFRRRQRGDEALELEPPAGGRVHRHSRAPVRELAQRATS
jgi:hypothetical protein